MRFQKIFSQTAFIKRAKSKARKNDWNLITASREVAKEITFGYIIYYGIGLLLVIGVLSILSFTDLLGGPFVLAQVVLFLVVGTLILAVVGVWWLWRRIKNRIKKLHRSTSHSEDSKIREGTVVSGQINQESEEK